MEKPQTMKQNIGSIFLQNRFNLDHLKWYFSLVSIYPSEQLKAAHNRPAREAPFEWRFVGGLKVCAGQDAQ